MAFDGSCVYAVVQELKREIQDGRIVKIAQTEKDELLLTIKKEGNQRRLLISVNPSLPLIYLTEETKNAPLKAPAFCMLLRKHLTNGHILQVSQPSMERIVEFEIEHFNEMGDLCRKILTVELMGKYSNIILREEEKILDSIRHVSALMSSVREVLPGRTYFIPFSEENLNPFTADRTLLFRQMQREGSLASAKALYTAVAGFSPQIAQEIFFRAEVDSDRPVSSITEEEKDRIFRAFCEVMEEIRDAGTKDPAESGDIGCGKETREIRDAGGPDVSGGPNIIYQNQEPVQYGVFHFRMYDAPGYESRPCGSISGLLHEFYSRKQAVTLLRQKTAGLRQSLHSLLNKNYKKYDLQQRQIRDTEKKEKYRVYGELLTAYGYNAAPGETVFETTDFYTGKELKIPLDPTLSAVENGKNYFKKYAKLKRTEDALREIIVRTKEDIDYLESVEMSLDLARNLEDIAEIRQELQEFARSGHEGKESAAGGSRGAGSGSRGAGSGSKGSGRTEKNRRQKDSKGSRRSQPLHYLSSDGFHIYVGKNNYQNDSLTFKLATGNDWWFHAKDIPGSHVIVKTEGQELPDRTYEEAASLAAHYSASAGSDKVEVQYTQKKNLKKAASGKPGLVVFHTYYSMAAATDISHLQEVQQS